MSEIATKKTIIVPVKKRTDSQESNVKKISAPRATKAKKVTEADKEAVKPAKAKKVTEADKEAVKPVKAKAVAKADKEVVKPVKAKAVAKADKEVVKPVKAKKVTEADMEVVKPAKSVKKVSDSKELDKTELRCIADAILDKKGSFVSSLDLSAIGTAICDYFVVCNADSRPQVLAIADNIEEMMHKKCGRKVLRMQGRENAFWIILDYANIVVHVFQTEYRQFYRLEDLWADAEKTIYTE